MNQNLTCGKYAVLFIDDEVQSQKYFSKIFGNHFTIYVASDGVEGLEMFRQHADEIGLVVSDQRMPNMTGSELLTEVSKLRPDVVKILSTAYSDIDAAIDAVNDGGIYRYITKPWDIPELEVTLRRAMEFFELKVQARQLSNVKIGGIEQIFLQSRLLATVAAPALLGYGLGAVRTYRDLLKFSLGDDDAPVQRKELSTDIFSTELRAEEMKKMHSRIEEVLEMAGAAQQKTAEEVTGVIQGFLGESDPITGRNVLSQSFIKLLAGSSESGDHERLANLIVAYGNGKKLDWRGGVLALVDSTESQEPSAVEELCSLFIDDGFLVSSFLSEIS